MPGIYRLSTLAKNPRQVAGYGWNWQRTDAMLGTSFAMRKSDELILVTKPVKVNISRETTIFSVAVFSESR